MGHMQTPGTRCSAWDSMTGAFSFEVCNSQHRPFCERSASLGKYRQQVPVVISLALFPLQINSQIGSVCFTWRCYHGKTASKRQPVLPGHFPCPENLSVPVCSTWPSTLQASLSGTFLQRNISKTSAWSLVPSSLCRKPFCVSLFYLSHFPVQKSV